VGPRVVRPVVELARMAEVRRRHLFGLLAGAATAPLLPKTPDDTLFVNYGGGEYVYDHKYVWKTYGVGFGSGPFGVGLNAMIKRREQDAINSLAERIFAEDLRGPGAAAGGGDAGGAPQVGEAAGGLPDGGWLSWTQDFPGSAYNEEG
jgi:hypothetical protein